MKIINANYVDHNMVVPGILAKKLFQKPVFYAADCKCSWSSQIITRKKKKNLVILPSIVSGRYCISTATPKIMRVGL